MPRAASLAAVLLCLAAGCNQRPLGTDDASRADVLPEAAPADTPLDPGYSCGTVELTGTTPEGLFSGSVVGAEVASDLPPHCQPSIRFRITDGAAGSSFEFAIPADAADAGGVPSGARSVEVIFLGVTPRTDNPRLTRTWTTSATVEVVTADMPPFATCEQAMGNPIALAGSDGVTLMINLAQDGFSVSGRVSARYCLCRACPDTV